MNILTLLADAKLANFLHTGFASEGHRCNGAKDGAHALQTLANHAFDALLLSDPHPDACAEHLCRQLRTQSAKVAVIVIGQKHQPARANDVLRSGADDYILRPFSFAQLSARLQALLRRTANYRASESPRIVIANLEIDRERHEVRYQGCLVPITAKEFSLLDLLGRSTGRVLSRTRILEAVWGYDSDPLTNVVDVHVANLRRKLHKPGHPSVIETVRGVGYKLTLAQSNEG
jgi:two-component system, OmpR family, response regulator